MEGPNLRLVGAEQPEKEFTSSEVSKKAEEIRIFIEAFAGSLKEKDISDQREFVDEYNIENVKSQIMKSEEEDWKANPDFYMALYRRWRNSLREIENNPEN